MRLISAFVSASSFFSRASFRFAALIWFSIFSTSRREPGADFGRLAKSSSYV